FTFNIAPKLPPGTGNGSIISNVNISCSSPGTRVATFKITNTVPFTPNSTINPLFNFAPAAGKTASQIFAYVCGSNTEITGNGKFYSYNILGNCFQNIALNPNNCNVTVSVSSNSVNCHGGSNGTA